MVFTWDWHNTCVVYKWWHVKTTQGFLGTMVAIVVLSMLYEFLRNWIRTWRTRRQLSLAAPAQKSPPALRSKMALLYAVQVGYSFMLMLVFMTYNGWYMLAVVAGAALGFYLWGDEAEARSMSCH